MLGLLARQPARWFRVPLLLLPVAGFALGRIDRGGLKGAVLRLLFGGLPRATVAAWAGRFAARAAREAMHPQGVATLQAHLAAGDRVVVLSASPDLYVPLLAGHLGAHEVHCTTIRWQEQEDRLDGRLAGANRRDEEKSRVLDDLRTAHPGLPVIAYGNSEADLVHMRRCEQAVYVNAPPALAASLSDEGITCVDWRRTGSR